MSLDPKLSRRQAVKTFALFTASSMLAGKKWTATVLAQVGPSSSTTGGVMKVKISDYPALGNTNGSVRIGTSSLVGPAACPRPRGLFPPLIINRGAGNQFHALEAACTHEGCIVPTYNATFGFSLCPNHGSRYSIDGTCLAGPFGGPPIGSLISHTVRFDGSDTLTIEVPDWSFDLTTQGVAPGNPNRIALRFLAFDSLEYQVQHRGTLQDEWAVVSFATSPTGPADQTVFVGPQFGTMITVYVDRAGASGFYSVSMRTQVV